MQRTTTKAFLVALTVLAIASPAMAQRGGVKRPAGANPNAGRSAHSGGMTHAGNSQIDPQAAMEQQFFQQMQMEQTMLQQQHAQRQIQTQQKAMNAFGSWLQAQGKSDESRSLPADPAAFQKWAANQKQKKAHGKAYDPTYDSYGQFQSEQRSNAQAAGKKGKTNANQAATATTKGNTGTSSTTRPLARDQAMIGLLRTIHLHLHGADADYDGNRIAAMGNIHQALRELGSPALARTDADRGHGNMVQTHSDAILREAAMGLQRIETQLAPVAGHSEPHSRAREQVRQAIAHLNTALSIN